MREHIRLLGILNIVMGCLTALIGIIALVVMGGLAGFVTASASDYGNDMPAGPILATIGVCIAIFFVLLALPSIIGGWGLMNFRPWSRILMIVVSVLYLFHVPFGTALGVYGLWVLLSDDGRRQFETGGRAYFPVPGAYPVPSNPPRTAYPPQVPPAQ